MGYISLRAVLGLRGPWMPGCWERAPEEAGTSGFLSCARTAPQGEQSPHRAALSHLFVLEVVGSVCQLGRFYFAPRSWDGPVVAQTIILGSSNPHPGQALGLEPRGCAGWRLWQMSGMSRDQYLSKFDRQNLFATGEEEGRAGRDRKFAAKVGEQFMDDLPGDTQAVVVLGGLVRDSLGLPTVLIHPVLIGGVQFRQIPHPSGRCLFYNEAACQDLIRLMLEDLP